ncbi:MAG: glycine cleavage system protein GcvH [Chloroflexota bacterium]
MHPVDRKYAKSHEWIKVEGNKALIGITSFAQEHLGDVVFVELPAVGRKLAKGEAFGVVESVKSVSDIYAPAGGTVTRVNDRLNGEPALINADAMGDGWIIEIELSDPADLNDLLDAAAYEKHLAEEGGH